MLFFLGRECDPLLLYLWELLLRNKQIEVYNCVCIYIYFIDIHVYSYILYIYKDNLERTFYKLYLGGLITVC